MFKVMDTKHFTLLRCGTSAKVIKTVKSRFSGTKQSTNADL